MTSVLINHPLPYADETLVSWLWHLTHENYAQSPALLLRHLRETASPTMPVMTRIMYGLHELASFRGLAELTNTSVETVYQHTLHRFVHALALPEQARHQLQVSTDGWLTLLSGRPPKDFYAQRFGWCPYCLKEARYVRLHWHVPLITCCEVHQCWLLEACPTCHRQLKESDILQGHCSYCEFCLEQAVSIPVPAGDLLLAMTATVMAWLYKERMSPQVNVPNSSPAALLRVLQGLRYNVQRAGNEWDFHHVPSGIQAPDLDIVRQRASRNMNEAACTRPLFVACRFGRTVSLPSWMRIENGREPRRNLGYDVSLGPYISPGYPVFGNTLLLTSFKRHSMIIWLTGCRFIRLWIPRAFGITQICLSDLTTWTENEPPPI